MRPAPLASRMAVVTGVVVALAAGIALAAAPLDDGEYRCDAASNTTAQFIYLTVDNGKVGAFELVAVNKLRADVCQLSLSHSDGEVGVQKNGWRVTFKNDDQVCRVALTRDGGTLVVKTTGEGCTRFCGAHSYFWELRYDLRARRCSIK
jgi:hypothetical protein